MKRRRVSKSNIFLLLGAILLILAVLFSAYNFSDDLRAGKSAEDILSRMATVQKEENGDYLLYPDMEMPIVRIDGTDYVGKLQIPRLELELPVISEESGKNLRISPCRYSGSAYNNTLVIAGHNYMSHFGRINNLNQGDEITFADVNGNSFVYKVCEIEILEPEAVNEMKDSDYDFSLFTCTFGGKYRLTLRCERVI